MKKIVSVVLTLVLCFGMLSLAGCNAGSSKTKLYVYNWGEYIPDGSDDSMNVVKAFEEKYPQYDVVYDTFTSNEALYAKLKSGTANYDLIIPSDYMISKLIEEDMLAKLNFDNIPNLSNVMSNFLNPDYDPDNAYSVPYLWGVVGLIYNTTVIDKAPTSWSVLWDEQYSGQILMFNNYRDAFGIAQKYLGYSQNTTDEAQLRACAQLLKDQKPFVQAYVMDEIFDKMESGEAAVAPYYAGDAITMMEENEDLAFVVPDEGTNWFVDAMCVPKGAKNQEGAELFMNFILEADVGLELTDFVGYATPNQAAYELLDEDTKNNEAQYPSDALLKKCDVFKSLPNETNELMSELWIEIKTEN